MEAQECIRRGAWQRVLLLLPWLLLITTVASFVIREIAWQSRMERLGEIEQLITSISRSPSEKEERDALQRLAYWAGSESITLSIYAYRRSDGTSVPIADIADREGSKTAFEVKFDMDGDHTPERTYHLNLRVPQHMSLLMME